MAEENVKTIADIARLAGVSKSTVSRAISNSPLIGETTKERIRAIVEQYRFQINVPAQRLSRMESRTIAFVTHAHYTQGGCSIFDPFYLEILGGVSGALSENHYDLLMAFVERQDTRWPKQYLDSGKADGFILTISSRKQSSIKSLVEINAPFIIWGNPLPNYTHCSVTGDDFTGGKLAAGYLIQSGRRRIGFIGGPEDELEVQRRYQGYAAAMQAAGVEIDPALVTYGDFTSASGADRMGRLLEQAPGLEAVFANSDVMAIAAMNLLHERGVRVPDDIAVVGYDNLSLAEQCHPALTTVSQDIPLAGRLLALNLIQYLQTGLVTNVSIPPRLVVRKSA